MDRLKEMLDGINVTYDERTFETEGSIARLGALVSHLINDLSNFDIIVPLPNFVSPIHRILAPE